jgi:hypothetical protein
MQFLTIEQEAMKKLDMATEFSRLLSMPFTDSVMRLTRQTVLKHYGPGVKEWGDVVSKFDGLSSTEPEEIPKDKIDDDLASWLDSSLHVEDTIEEEHPKACSHPVINSNRVELYRCSWCGNPSAVLRKCRACGLARCVGIALMSSSLIRMQGTVTGCARKTTGANTRPLASWQAQRNDHPTTCNILYHVVSVCPQCSERSNMCRTQSR